MKKVLFVVATVAALMVIGSCGNNNSAKAAQSAKAQNEKTTKAADKKDGNWTIDNNNYVETVTKEFGFNPNVSDKLTFKQAFKVSGYAHVEYTCPQNLNEDEIVKLYYDKCVAAADGGVLYGFFEDFSNGSFKKTDPIEDFSEYNQGHNWVYDYKGKLVYFFCDKEGELFSVMLKEQK